MRRKLSIAPQFAPRQFRSSPPGIGAKIRKAVAPRKAQPLSPPRKSPLLSQKSPTIEPPPVTMASVVPVQKALPNVAAGDLEPLNATPKELGQKETSNTKVKRNTEKEIEAIKKIEKTNIVKVSNTTKSMSPQELYEALSVIEIPAKGPIPSAIDMKSISESNPNALPPEGIIYEKRAVPGAPNGVESFLRECFALQRKNKGRGVNVLLVGPPGTGKTESARFFAQESGLALWTVPGENIDPALLLGHKEIVSDGHSGTKTVFVEGIIPQAARYGGILLLDEINVYPQDVQIRINELLDDRRTLTLQENNNEVIKAHPDLLVVAAMNPPESSDATNQLIPQLRSRFTKNLWLPAPTESEQLEFVQKKLAIPSQEFARIRPDVDRAIKVNGSLRELEKKGSIDYSPTLREVFTIASDLRNGLSLKEALLADVYNKYYNEDERSLVAGAIHAKTGLNI